MSDQKSGDAGGSGQNSAGTIQVGDKTYSAGDIESILAQQSKATEALQSLSAVQTAAAKYGMEVEDFLQNAEGSFAAVSDLIDQGLIDAQGNVIKPAGKKTDEDDLFASLLGKKGSQEGSLEDRTAEGGRTAAMLTGLVQKMSSLEKAIQGYEGEITSLRQDNNALIRHQVTSTLRTSVDGLQDASEEDLSFILGRAQADKSKSLKEHAQAFVNKRTSLLEQGKKELAKQLGIEDLDAHLNSLKQQDAGSGPAEMFTGKKISFKAGKDAVHPRDAAAEYLNRAIR